MKSAVKEAIKSQEAILGTIAEKVKEEAQEIANKTVEKIKEMNPELAKQLTPRVANKSWDSLFSVSLTGDEDIPINKRGSGTRRLVLLNFFRARAEREAEGKGTDIIYAIEEPETSQHPNNQKMLVEAIQDLADRDGCQVFLTTHTPVLARRFDQAFLRFVTQKNGKPEVRHGNEEATLTEILDTLGVLPDHRIKVFVGVEGKHDITFLCCLSKRLSEAGEILPDLRKEEEEGNLVFVPLGGNNLDLWVSRLKGFNRPEFYLMDRDTEPPSNPKYHVIAKELNHRNNCTAWTTNKKELENYIHPDVIKFQYPGYSGSGKAFEDVPKLFAQAVHKASNSEQSWDDVIEDQEKLGKKVSNAKKRLNNEFVSKMNPELLSKIDSDDEVRGWLREIGKALETE